MTLDDATENVRNAYAAERSLQSECDLAWTCQTKHARAALGGLARAKRATADALDALAAVLP